MLTGQLKQAALSGDVHLCRMAVLGGTLASGVISATAQMLIRMIGVVFCVVHPAKDWFMDRLTGNMVGSFSKEYQIEGLSEDKRWRYMKRMVFSVSARTV